MSILASSALLADANPTKSPDGAFGLLVFLILAVVVVFLFRSMNKHLRKVRAMKFDDDAKVAAAKIAKQENPRPN